MAAATVQNPPVLGESKSAKKKKAKLERTESPAPASTPAENPGSVAGDGEDGENPYIRELQKNIRNVIKKIGNITKTEAVVLEHKGKSLDELVKQKIINADQKASIQKKEGLQTQLSQLEEQLSQYKKVDQEFRTRTNQIKTEVEKTLTDRYEKEKADAVADVKAELGAGAEKSLRDSLLVLSQFLRLAAARRGEEHDSELDENRALEGVLLQVYSGDEEGVSTMLKLVKGSLENAKSVASEPLEATFAQIKQAAVAHAVPLYTGNEAAAAEQEEIEPATDPTIANAGLTEIDAGVDVAITASQSVETLGESDSTAAPANASVAAEAANAAAESQWDAGNASMSASQEWVEVPRDLAETEHGLTATTAEPGNTQSWADDAADHAAEVRTVPADPNDGFQSVQGRNRGRGDREGGNWRGRGNFRGNRGFRGDGRGRGRGRGRGGNGAHHQPRNNDES